MGKQKKKLMQGNCATYTTLPVKSIPPPHSSSPRNGHKLPQVQWRRKKKVALVALPFNRHPRPRHRRRKLPVCGFRHSCAGQPRGSGRGASGTAARLPSCPPPSWPRCSSPGLSTTCPVARLSKQPDPWGRDHCCVTGLRAGLSGCGTSSGNLRTREGVGEGGLHPPPASPLLSQHCPALGHHQHQISALGASRLASRSWLWDVEVASR